LELSTGIPQPIFFSSLGALLTINVVALNSPRRYNLVSRRRGAWAPCLCPIREVREQPRFSSATFAQKQQAIAVRRRT